MHSSFDRSSKRKDSGENTKVENKKIKNSSSKDDTWQRTHREELQRREELQKMADANIQYRYEKNRNKWQEREGKIDELRDRERFRVSTELKEYDVLSRKMRIISQKLLQEEIPNAEEIKNAESLNLKRRGLKDAYLKSRIDNTKKITKLQNEFDHLYYERKKLLEPFIIE